MRYAIGDVHGRPFWKNYLDKDYEAFFFAGDYFDSFNIPFSKQYRNFKEISEAARQDRRIKLCLGNHDYHYLSGVNDQYSGFQQRRYNKINEILEASMDLFKIVYVTGDNLIISHAGLTRWFLESTGGSAPEDVNRAFEQDRRILAFNGRNIYGDDITQSPIWIRPASLREAALPGYDQIAGHTPVEEITRTELNGGVNTLTLIDTHDTESIYRF